MTNQLFRNVLSIFISIASFSDSFLTCFYSMTNLILCCWTIDLIFMYAGKNLKEFNHLRILMYFICIFAKLFYLILVILSNSYHSMRPPNIFDPVSNETKPRPSYENIPENSVGFAISLCVFFMVNTSVFLLDVAYEDEIIRQTIFYNVCIGIEAGAMVSILFVLQSQNNCREKHSESEARWIFASSILQLLVISSPFSEFIFKFFQKLSSQHDDNDVSHPQPLTPLDDIENMRNSLH
jgi:hypothetical protein